MRDSGAVRLREFTKLGEASVTPVRLKIKPGEEIQIRDEKDFTILVEGGLAELLDEEQSR
jgi:hypothetical protein